MTHHREAIHKEIEDYWKKRTSENDSFIPGEDYVSYAGAVYDSREVLAMVDVILDGWFGVGKKGAEFEKRLSRYIGMDHGSVVNSGSSANLLAITALMESNMENGLKPGDEVITPASTFPTTFNPIVQNNLTPVLLDVDPATFNMSLEYLDESISDKTRLMMIPHTLGNPHNMDRIMDFAHKHDLFVIEDSCDSLGSRYDGKMCGSFGDLSTFSFYPAHHMTMGEGGAVLSKSKAIARAVRSLRDWGRACWCTLDEKNPMGTCRKRFDWELGNLPAGFDHKYIYSSIGYNLKPLELQAAMGLIQLEKLDYFESRRFHNFTRLYEIFTEYEDYFILPVSEEKAEPNWFAIPFTIKANAPFSRHKFVTFFEDNKVATRHVFAGNILRHPAYKNIKYRIVGDLTFSDIVLENSFFLGVFPGITNEQIDYIERVLKDFISKLPN